MKGNENMERRKPNRNRKNLVRFFVNEKELAIIEKRAKQMKMKSKSEYLRQIAVNGKVVTFDGIDFKKCYNEIHKIGVNINQMAKVANQTGNIYKDDVEMMKQGYVSFRDSLDGIFLKILDLIEITKKQK